jgi:hypothetical protein
MKQTIRGFNDDYVARYLADKILQEVITPDEALKRQIWDITGTTQEGKIMTYDGSVLEYLVEKALKIVEKMNKVKKSVG